MKTSMIWAVFMALVTASVLGGRESDEMLDNQGFSYVSAYAWRVDNGFVVEGGFLEVDDAVLVVREEQGGVTAIPLDLLTPRDQYRALKWEGQRQVFTPFVGLELATLVLPKKQMPLDDALHFVWEQAREVRPDLPEEPPNVQIIGDRDVPSVSANITGSLDAIYAMTLLCEMARFHWVYTEGEIIVGPRSAMAEIAAFREKERFQAEHEERIKPLRDELGIGVTFDIRIIPDASGRH